MRAGRMDRLVMLRIHDVSSQDEYGEEVDRWQDVPVWAERRQLRGTERFVAQQRLASLDARYFLHYRSDVKSRDQIIDGEQTYDIHAVLEIGRREGLELIVTHREGE